MQNVAINFISYFFTMTIIEAVLVTFVAIVFATFVDTISITYIISSHAITEVSTILFRYSPFTQKMC